MVKLRIAGCWTIIRYYSADKMQVRFAVHGPYQKVDVNKFPTANGLPLYTSKTHADAIMVEIHTAASHISILTKIPFR